MKDSLAAERAEILRVIEHLEEVAIGLQGYNVGVSQQDLRDLKRLRERVAKPREPEEWRKLTGLAMEFLARLAVELLLRALS